MLIASHLDLLRGRVSALLTFVWRRLMIRTTVIAITGSVGKTTAKECLAAALESHGPVLKTFQNQNDHYGVPRTIRAMRPWHRFAVVEVGVQGPGYMRRLAHLLKPDIAVVLRVARTHTNKFGDLETTAAEKAELLSFLPRHGIAVLNADDDRVCRMAKGSKQRTVFFGSSPACDYRAEKAESRWPDRLRFEFVTGKQRFDVRTQLVGTHWLNSVLAALVVADSCGIPVGEAVRRIAQVPPFMGRMQPVALPNGAIIMRDEVNGSPDTLQAMLEVLRNARAKRRGLVFSDQSDSKDSPRRRLRNIGHLAAGLCDFAVFVGAHAHHAVRAATDAGMDASCCREFRNIRDAAEWLEESLRAGDLVFLKGRSTDHLSRILFAQFGKIGCWKSSCNITRLCDVCSELEPDFDLDKVLTKDLQ
ncbi:UDP-N-acetylmuramoyl-tripeptide--D-alanyl-D-alanine ligase [Thiogranum longum]|uniref:UDP-N-acetylmuramoyl-tripeptide--D-alanyl-D-alanine ligase n=1 Tax=Thiogranum longum TaxID=1537524 RepID=A0A4R1HFC0_9GAMM|nr:UDP-N-acetylmuramoyl-tripeptide--D-alanyl-D-alanine ligase [Thiogranum longum]TCK19035.1 UDP-N-acetylmuramoyl-tripeptide--D-alanyl-D-alanine ligase [Thiogranum longum]